MKAELCPVCKGTGKYVRFPYLAGTNAAEYEQVCHGCGGQGWVQVPEGQPYYPLPYFDLKTGSTY